VIEELFFNHRFCLNNAIKLQPNDAKTYNQRGDAYKNLGQYQCAIEDYIKVSRQKTGSCLGLFQPGGCLFYER
jgi:tetratricopeptide (TPR) repeat protein